MNGGAKIHWAESHCISEALMGVGGRLFNGSGVLLEAGWWVYDDPCDDTIYSNTDRRTGHGNYYGKGITHALYAPDYSTVYTYYNDPYIHYDP